MNATNDCDFNFDLNVSVCFFFFFNYMIYIILPAFAACLPVQINHTVDKNGQKDDPNEDWCAVCLDGGELMCCDKCPKVFHQTCHIPNISSLPDESETWQCLLCVNLAELRTGTFSGLFTHTHECLSPNVSLDVDM